MSYAFCFYSEQDASTVTSPATPWSVLTYGSLQTTGPVSRRGRAAVIAHDATGYRTVTTGVANASATAYTAYVAGVRGIDLDESSGYVYNDNAMYLSAPFFDDEGLVLVLSSNAVYPSLVVPTTDVQLYKGDVQGWYNEITPFVLVNGSFVYGYASSSQSFFQYSTQVTGAVMAASKCQGANVTTSTEPGGNGAKGTAAGVTAWVALSLALGCMVVVL